MVSGRSHGSGAGLSVEIFLRQAGGGMMGGYGPMGGGGCDARFQPYGMMDGGMMGCGMPCMGMGCMGNGMAGGSVGGVALGARRATPWLGAGLGRGNDM